MEDTDFSFRGTYPSAVRESNSVGDSDSKSKWAYNALKSEESKLSTSNCEGARVLKRKNQEDTG